MNTVINEFRVRPVERYNLTHYKKSQDSGSSRTIAELPTADAAILLGRALRDSNPGSILIDELGRPMPMDRVQFVIVQRGFDPSTIAYYAETYGEAETTRDRLQADSGHEFRIFSRRLDETEMVSPGNPPGTPAETQSVSSRFPLGAQVVRCATDIRCDGPGSTGILHHYEAEAAEVIGVHFYVGKVCYDVTYPSGRRSETVDSTELSPAI